MKHLSHSTNCAWLITGSLYNSARRRNPTEAGPDRFSRASIIQAAVWCRDNFLEAACSTTRPSLPIGPSTCCISSAWVVKFGELISFPIFSDPRLRKKFFSHLDCFFENVLLQGGGGLFCKLPIYLIDERTMKETWKVRSWLYRSLIWK